VADSNLPKRFYDAASFLESAEGFAILLDGKTVRTPARTELCVAGKALAEGVVNEWNAQKDVIDPASMPMTTRANTALDRVRGRESEVVDELVEYAGSDLLCYRADGPEGLVALQSEHWDPVLWWIKSTLGAEFITQTGISHINQPAQSLEIIRGAFSGFDPYVLTPLHTMTTLTGSAMLPLAHLRGHLTKDELWTATHVDEDWQISQWGEDDEAIARRALRRAELGADICFLELVKA
jgi:chaperone required for assembly of F1-ATPase